jgi:hypothetical protein
MSPQRRRAHHVTFMHGMGLAVSFPRSHLTSPSPGGSSWHAVTIKGENGKAYLGTYLAH